MSRGVAVALTVAIAVAIGVAWSRSSGQDAGAGAVTLVGDSLNVGTSPYLREELRGWTVRDDSVVGRSTPEGLVALAALHGDDPVVVSLGTNDPVGTTAAFASEVRRALELAGNGRCVVWATIWREDGPDEGFNKVLREIAAEDGDLRVLPWAEMLAEHPSYLAADHLHGSPEGYAARAAEAARLVRDCPRQRGESA